MSHEEMGKLMAQAALCGILEKETIPEKKSEQEKVVLKEPCPVFSLTEYRDKLNKKGKKV